MSMHNLFCIVSEQTKLKKHQYFTLTIIRRKGKYKELLGIDHQKIVWYAEVYTDSLCNNISWSQANKIN